MKTKILLCDRDITFLGVTRIKLQQEGYDVETINHCDLLMSAASNYHPEVICVDIGFDSAGCEAMIRMLKSDDKTSGIPVLVFSTKASDRDAVMKAGAVTHLIKPFQVSDFEEALRQIKK